MKEKKMITEEKKKKPLEGWSSLQSMKKKKNLQGWSSL